MFSVFFVDSIESGAETSKFDVNGAAKASITISVYVIVGTQIWNSISGLERKIYSSPTVSESFPCIS